MLQSLLQNAVLRIKSFLRKLYKVFIRIWRSLVYNTIEISARNAAAATTTCQISNRNK